MTQVRCVDNIVDDDDTAGMYQLSKGQLIELVTQLEADKAQMKADFLSFNKRLNRTARHYDWCSSYEARLREYGADMKILRPVSRRDEDLGHVHDSYPTSTQACLHCGGQCFIQCYGCERRWTMKCPSCGNPDVKPQ